jgi:hypothetical protein
MDKEYILELYNNLGGESSFGKYSDFEKLITTDVQYQKDFHSSFGKETLGDFKDFSSLVQKKNSKSTGTPTQGVSPAKQEAKPITSVGGKQPQATPSVSSFGAKIKEPSPLDLVPSYGKEKPKKITRETDKVKTFNQKLVDDAVNYSIKNLDTSITEKKLEDELNEYQFLDGVKQGLTDFYNKRIGLPLALATDNDNFMIKKEKPLSKELKQAEEEFAKEGKSVRPDILMERAKEIFRDRENREQQYKLVDKFLPEDYARDKIWKEINAKAIQTNDKLRSVVTSYQAYSDELKAFEDLHLSLDSRESKEYSQDELAKYESSRNKAMIALENLKLLEEDYDYYASQAKNDDEVLDLFKFNYNDYQKSFNLVGGGFAKILGGSMKLIANTGKYINQELGFKPTVSSIMADLVGSKLIDMAEESQAPFLRYKASDLNNLSDVGSFSTQLISEQAPVMASIAIGGTLGTVAVSLGSGGETIRRLEKEEQQPFAKQTSLGTKVVTGWLYAGAEFGPEFLGTQRLIKGIKSSVSNASTQGRRLYYDGLKKASVVPLKVVKSTGIESATEVTTGVLQIGIDIGVLDKEITVKDAGERLYEAGVSGGLMGGVLGGFGPALQFSVAQAKVYSDRKDIKRVKDLTSRIETLNKEILENPLLTKEEATELYKEINSKTNEAFDIVSKNANKDKDFSLREKAELLNINLEQKKLSDSYKEIKTSNFSESIKDSMIKEMENKFNALEKKRNDILSKTYDPLSALPIEESTKLKSEAADQLEKEAVDSGIEKNKVNITEEQVNQRARENYEKQFEETTAKESAEEKPTGEQEVESTTTTQGQPNQVVQEEINSIREDFDNNNLNAISINVSRDGFSGEFLDDYYYLAEGSEHIVYRSKDGKTVIKIGEPYGSNEGFMPRVEDALRINRIIGDGSLRLIGYYENNGIKNPVYSQNFVEGDVLSQEEVSNHLESKGFVSIGKDKFAIKIDGKIYEISDTSDNFIKDKDGNVFAVDAGIFELKESDLTSDQISKINNTTSEKTKQVEELRQQEIAEFNKEVENAEDFITDGRVDAKKVAESDNAKAKEIYAKYDAQIKPLLDNIKTQEDAIQKQSTGQVPVQSETTVSEEMEQGESEAKPKVVTEQSEEEITKIKADLEASKERVKNALNKYKNVNIAFDPKNELAKDKELVKALLDYAYNNIRLGKYNAVKLIEDLAKDGIEITRDGAKYIYDRASKRVQREINKAVGVKPKPTEQKRINKAFGIGVATQKVETEKQKEKTKEVKSEMSELKKQFNDIVSAIKTEKDIVKKEALQKQADRLNKKIADLREKSKAEISELKDQIRDIFSVAKDALKIQKDKAKTISGIKKQISDFIKENLSNVDPKDINKTQQKSLLNALVSVNDKNFEEVLEDVLNVFEAVEAKKAEATNKAYDGIINKIIKPYFYANSKDGKVTKTKITDKTKKEINKEIDAFSKIKNPTLRQKEEFINKVTDLKKQGIEERKSIAEKSKADKVKKSSTIAIGLLEKKGVVLKEVSIDVNNESQVEKAFKSGGVIFNGVLYPNTEVGKNKFKKEAGLSRVKVRPYTDFKVVLEGKQLPIFERVKRAIRGYSFRTSGLTSFALALSSTKENKEFVDKYFRLPLQELSTRRLKLEGIFKANRNFFYKSVGIPLKKSKIETLKWASGKYKSLRAKEGSALDMFNGQNKMFKLDGKGASYSDMISDFDDRISKEKDPAKINEIKRERSDFELKYKAFENLRNQHIIDLFNMIRQPDGLSKFLNEYSPDVAIMVADYINSNKGLRDIADKSIILYKAIATQMNPALDKAGYDTFNDKKFSKKEDEINVIENNKNLSDNKKASRIKKVNTKYEILNKIYPEGIPEFIPYYPLSAEGEVSTSDEGKFFEDGATNDYSLVFPNLITRKGGGKLVFGKKGILPKYEAIYKEAVSFIVGNDLMGLSQELLTGTNGKVLKQYLGDKFVEGAKEQVLGVVKNKSVAESVYKLFKDSKVFANIYSTQGLILSSQLIFSFNTIVTQLLGVAIMYTKNPAALNPKFLKEIFGTKEGLSDLRSSLSIVNSSTPMVERINHKKDSAEIKLLEEMDRAREIVDKSLVTALVSDLMVFTTLSDQLSILLSLPIFLHKKKALEKSKGKLTTDDLDNLITGFFGNEVNVALQSNDYYYVGSNYKNAFVLLLGIGKYEQALRQIGILSAENIADAYNKRRSIADASGRVISYGGIGLVLGSLLTDMLLGEDDEDEEKKTVADKETEMYQMVNKATNSILVASGTIGTSLIVLKDAYLTSERPEVLGVTKPKGDMSGVEILNLATRSALKNVSVPLRNLDIFLDKQNIYTTTDQALAASQLLLGPPLLQLKKQSDYLSAYVDSELTFRQYAKFLENKWSVSDFKKIESEMNRYRDNVLALRYRKYKKDNILNDSFLDSKERDVLSKLPYAEKPIYLENLRLNKITEEYVLKYQEALNLLEETKNVGRYYDVRKARFVDEFSDMVYNKITNVVDYKANRISKEDANKIYEEINLKLVKSVKEFKLKEEVSDVELSSIAESAFSKVINKIEDDFADTTAKSIDGKTKGRSKATALYELYKFANEKGKTQRYSEVFGEGLEDDATKAEFYRLIKEGK